MDIKEIASGIKTQLKKEFPTCVFSVGCKRYSGGQSLNISLMKGPFSVFEKDVTTNGYKIEKFHAQLNQYQFNDVNDERISNGVYLTQKAWDVMKRAYDLTKKHNWDRSDIQTDYFDVNFYLHLHIGKWDNPYKVI